MCCVSSVFCAFFFFFFQAEDGIRDDLVTGVQTCALPISNCNHRLNQAHARLGFSIPQLMQLALASHFWSLISSSTVPTCVTCCVRGRPVKSVACGPHCQSVDRVSVVHVQSAVSGGIACSVDGNTARIELNTRGIGYRGGVGDRAPPAPAAKAPLGSLRLPVWPGGRHPGATP